MITTALESGRFERDLTHNTLTPKASLAEAIIFGTPAGAPATQPRTELLEGMPDGKTLFAARTDRAADDRGMATTPEGGLTALP